MYRYILFPMVLGVLILTLMLTGVSVYGQEISNSSENAPLIPSPEPTILVYGVLDKTCSIDKAFVNTTYIDVLVSCDERATFALPLRFKVFIDNISSSPSLIELLYIENSTGPASASFMLTLNNNSCGADCDVVDISLPDYYRYAVGCWYDSSENTTYCNIYALFHTYNYTYKPYLLAVSGYHENLTIYIWAVFSAGDVSLRYLSPLPYISLLAMPEDRYSAKIVGLTAEILTPVESYLRVDPLLKYEYRIDSQTTYPIFSTITKTMTTTTTLTTTTTISTTKTRTVTSNVVDIPKSVMSGISLVVVMMFTSLIVGIVGLILERFRLFTPSK